MGFWEAHGGFILGMIFIICLITFPRVTMLLAVATPFGFLAWIGWLICPYLLAAFLATTMYRHTNPILCIFSWMVAFGGTSVEVTYTKKQIREYR